MSAIKGTNVFGAVVPFDTNDIYSTHHALYGKGGWRTVINLTERDNITLDRRENLMVVVVENNSYISTSTSGAAFYLLDVNHNASTSSLLLDNNNWVLLDFGYGGDGWIFPPPTQSIYNGNKGQRSFDGTYLYICVEDNLWKRVAIDWFVDSGTSGYSSTQGLSYGDVPIWGLNGDWEYDLVVAKSYIDSSSGLLNVVYTNNFSTSFPVNTTLVANLNDLLDVDITNATSGDVLIFNGSNWVNGLPNGLNWIQPPPISTYDIGNKGDASYDDDFIYICIQPNIWKRINIDYFLFNNSTSGTTNLSIPYGTIPYWDGSKYSNTFAIIDIQPSIQMGNVGELITYSNGTTSFISFGSSGNSVDNTTAGNGLTLLNNKVILGGSLTNNTLIDGTFGLNINTKKFEIENRLNPPFNKNGSGFGSEVMVMDIQSDGKILVGGGFTAYNGVNCNRNLVRLNLDGSLDTSFNNGGSGFDLYVNAIAIQSDGKILVGGYFFTYNGIVCNKSLIRLNLDGTLDTSFNNGGSGFDLYVNAIAIQSDGKILVGGYFSTYNGVDCVDSLVRLNLDGTLDTSFNSGGSGLLGTVNTIAIQSDGNILVGGYFNTYNGNICNSGLIRLNSDGSLDTSFNNGNVGFDLYVDTIAIQSDDTILAGGYFTTYNGIVQNNITRILADGSLDLYFNRIGDGNGFNQNIKTIAIQSDGKILVGGFFNTYYGFNTTYGIVRLETNGSLDTTFNYSGVGFNSYVNKIITQINGDIFVGGGFSAYNNENCPNLVRLNINGFIDDEEIVKVIMDNNGGLLKYEKDYSNSFTNRTLVDKEYVIKTFESYKPSTLNFKKGNITSINTLMENEFNQHVLPIHKNGNISIISILFGMSSNTTITDTMTFDIRYIYSGIDGSTSDVTAISGISLGTFTITSGQSAGTRYNRTFFFENLSIYVSTGANLFVVVSDIHGSFSASNVIINITIV